MTAVNRQLVPKSRSCDVKWPVAQTSSGPRYDACEVLQEHSEFISTEMQAISYSHNFLNYLAFTYGTLFCSEVKQRKWHIFNVTVIASRQHYTEHHRQGRWSMDSMTVFLSASLYVSKRGAYWDRLCRDVVGRWLVVGCCHARALWPNGAS